MTFMESEDLTYPSYDEARAAHLHPQRRDISIKGQRTTVFTYTPTPGSSPHPISTPRIVAVHGFRGTHSGLDRLARSLASHGFTVDVPDLPGCGYSQPVQTEHTMGAFVQWLRELTDTYTPPPILLGHSLGSVIVAAAIKEKVPAAGAVLVNPISAPMGENPHRFTLGVAELYFAAARHLPSSLGNALLRSRIYAGISGTIMAKSTEPGIRRWVLLQHLRTRGNFTSARAVEETYRTSLRWSIPDFADSLCCPVLLLGGELDDISPLEAQKTLAASMPTADYRAIRGVGHLIPYEAPAWGARTILQWTERRFGEPTFGSRDSVIA